MPVSSSARRRRVLLNRRRPPTRPKPAPSQPPAARPGSGEIRVPAARTFGDDLPFLKWPPGGPAVTPQVRVTDVRDGTVVPLGCGAPQVTLGSDAALHLTLPDLAPRHAALQAVPGGLLVFAAVRGGLERVGARTDAALLRAGGVARLGPYELEVRRVAPLPPGGRKPRLHRYLPRDPSPQYRGRRAEDGVTVGWRGGSARLSPRTPVLTVGSHRRAAVPVPDAPPLCALLLFTPAGPAVADLRSGAGLVLNGSLTRRAPVAPGARLEIGGATLTVSG